ncbi:MAG: DUF819 family protein [Candidatus Aminicenantes bacterium]|nr:DUF819 family protein [Candidatus Aminicenantes bacterium]
MAQFGAKKSKLIHRLGPIILCYIFGILLINIFHYPIHKPESMLFTEFTVALAIPLLLFSTDFLHWLSHAKKTALSIGIAFGSILISSSIGAFVFANKIEESKNIAGMLVGVYTGGTPNMSAIGMALSVKKELFILINAVDMIFGAIYLVFLMSIAQKVLRKFLPPSHKIQKSTKSFIPETRTEKISFQNIFMGIGFSVLIVGFSIGLSQIITGEIRIALVILTLTTLSIIFSFNKRIRTIKGSFDSGQYFLLMFCVAIGTLVDVKELLIASPIIFLYVGLAMFGAIIFHYVLAAVFKIDVDTVLITSTGAIYGPALVGPIAGVLKNREAVVTGLAAGLLGYALGNYLGIGLAMLLKFI